MPEPRPDECVVFYTHFLVAFGLPGSIYLQQFLEFCGFQTHHLGPNSILYLMCFTTLCEAYLGFWTFSSFFCHLFHFRAHVHRHGPYFYGGVVVYRRVGWLLPKMKFKKSFKKRQHTFFYVHSIGLVRDWVNLTPFSDEPLTGVHWDLDMRSDELAVIVGRMSCSWLRWG
ncbi:hypothetical protein D1007_17430 [Hordeum vulgare]|nr:hypothetical protein D1007_17430 [Hordeum vulgare]